MAYGAVEDCWPPSPMLDQEDGEEEINKLDLDHVL